MYAPVAFTPPIPVTRSNDVNGATPYAVDHLSDAALLAGTRSLVARSNQQLARLLAHLSEVEARGIHRAQACATLCAYCIYELRLSEDTAFRYARAAKLARRFPVLFEQVAAGEIHLTGLLLLGPHLTEENHREVLRLAKHRSKREIAQLVRRLDPLPDAPSRIEPLGPTRTGQSVSNGTWSAFMQALNPVRELAPTVRPSAWLQPDADVDDGPASAGGSRHQGTGTPAEAAEVPETVQPAKLGFDSADALDRDAQRVADVAELTPDSTQESSGDALSLNSQRYSVQFTAAQEYVDLVERARDLLSHAVPNRSLAEVHLRAMRLLVAKLEKRRFGAGQSARSAAPDSNDVGDEPRRRRTRGSHAEGSSVSSEIAEPFTTGGHASRGVDTSNRDASNGAGRDREVHRRNARDRDARDRDARDRDANHRGASNCDSNDGGGEPRAAGEFSTVQACAVPRRRGKRSSPVADKPSGRYIRADVRREVVNRDGRRCAYVSADGQRCAATSFLELHHHDPYAQGGVAEIENLSLYCRAHNALAAERDFGRTYMARRSGRE